MSFLSRIFGGTNPVTQASLVGWADRKMNELEGVNDITPERMFIGFMYSLVSYAREDGASRQPESPEYRDMKSNAALFELGCYVFFRVDMWLFLNRREHRARISGTFVREFKRLFAEVLVEPNIEQIFQHRTTRYGELAREHADVEQFHEYLTQAMLHTTKNKKPELFDQNSVTMGASYGDEVMLKMRIAMWEQHLMPSIIDSMEQAVSMLK